MCIVLSYKACASALFFSGKTISSTHDLLSLPHCSVTSIMSSQLKPIKLYGFGRTANPMKVAIILEELGLAFEQVPVAFADVKKPEYTAINPNGRLPSIIDPNTGITLWESGAILEYLIETYD